MHYTLELPLLNKLISNLSSMLCTKGFNSFLKEDSYFHAFCLFTRYVGTLKDLNSLYFCACNKSGFTFYFRVYFCSGCAIYNFVKATFDLEKLNGKI